MAELINFTRDERAIREREAANELLAKGQSPTQESIYTQAYGTPNVVFGSDYDLPKIEQQLKGISESAADVPARLRSKLVKPKREAKFLKKVNKQLADFDPATKQALRQSILAQRGDAQSDLVTQRLLGESSAFSNALAQYNLQKGKADTQLAGLQAGENAQAELQNYIAKKQIDAQFKKSSGSGSGSASLVGSAGVEAQAQYLADSYFEDIGGGQIRGQIDPDLITTIPSKDRGIVQARANEMIQQGLQQSLAQQSFEPVDGVNNKPTITAADFAYGVGDTLRSTPGAVVQGFDKGTSGVGSFFKNIVSGIVGK